MIDLNDIPISKLEQVTMLEGILVECATGGSNDSAAYEYLRRELMRDSMISSQLPPFVRTYRNLGAFWPYIKNEAGSYSERRQLISVAFRDLLDWLEGLDATLGDAVSTVVLQSFDVEGVHAVWAKALERRSLLCPLKTGPF